MVVSSRTFLLARKLRLSKNPKSWESTKQHKKLEDINMEVLMKMVSLTVKHRQSQFPTNDNEKC